MSDLLRQGSAMLHRTRRESVSHEVVYRRGTGEEAIEFTILATVSATSAERIDSSGSVLVRYRDFCFETTELLEQLGSEPRPGDVVVETNGETAERYEAVKGAGEGCFRREGLQHESIRVHTQNVGVEP